MRAWMGGILAVGLLVLTGCGGGNGDEDDGGGDPSATGQWSFVDPGGNHETVHLTQSGNQVSGNTDRGGTVSGTASGATYNIRIVYANNYTITLSVTISDDNMTGAVTDSSGRNGTIAATRLNSNSGGDDGDESNNPDISSAYTVGTWFAVFQGRTIRLRFSNGTATDSYGFRLNSVSGNLWNGQPFANGSHVVDIYQNEIDIGIMVPADGHLAEGLGWFVDSTHLHLGWYDSTYPGAVDGEVGYCGLLTFVRQ
jgi:hypothetical protein